MASKPRPPRGGPTLINARTINQKKYLQELINPQTTIIVGTGPAGSGKTYLACHAAINSLKQKEVDKIIITRPMVSVDDEQMGFLPGSIQQKMDPWTRPIFDTLKEIFDANQIQKMIDSEIIEISPLAYMRGRTFKNAYIVADEMQNSSPNQMLMLMTRVGENTKMAITGDLMQSDKRSDKRINKHRDNQINKNGLMDLIERIRTSNNHSNHIKHIELETEDIQRSKVISEILYMYNIKNP